PCSRSVYRAAVFFLFSRRRRHTRSSRDWSSDVCSSDLEGEPLLLRRERSEARNLGSGLAEQAGQAEQGLQRWGRVRVGVAVADEDATLGGADSQKGVFVFALDREAPARDGGVSGEDTGALLERDDELGLVGSANLDEIAVVVPVEIVEETTVGARLAGLRGGGECGLDGAELGELRTAVHELVEDEVLWKTKHDGWRRAERGGKHEVRGAVAVVGEGDGLLEVAVPEPSARSRLAQVD